MGPFVFRLLSLWAILYLAIPYIQKDKHKNYFQEKEKKSRLWGFISVNSTWKEENLWAT